MKKFKKVFSSTLLMSSALVLAGCSVTPEPLTMEDHLQRIERDSKALFANQEKIDAPITLYDAMARALKYNLDQRLKLMETVLSRKNLTMANFSLLPQMTVEAGYTGRDNHMGSNSQSLTSGQESLESSTSSDRELKSASLGFTWNVLDFGLSYVRAQQLSDRVLISEERRRKVVHNIIQDVRAAFWDAASAQRLLDRIAPLTQTVQKALQDAKKAERSGQETPLAALRYQRELLDSLRQLKIMRRELHTAKTRLSTLMNLKPGTDFKLDTGNVGFDVPDLQLQDVERLEKIALLHRPELREEAYQARISHNDVRKAYLRMLPGLELNTAWNFDSNSYAWEQTWWSWGASINKNLFEVFTGPEAIEQAEGQVDVVDYRRYALSMAVMSQVHVALAGYVQSVDEFKTVSELYRVEDSIKGKIQANVRAGSAGNRDAIRAELQAVLSELRRDLAFTDMRNSVGRLYLTLGADPLPDTIENTDVRTLAGALKKINEDWYSGRIAISDGSEVKKAKEAADNEAKKQVEQVKKTEQDEDGFFSTLASWFAG
ncbi:TolC family protein [Terasakiella brassicae]|uniref:TolC family protein n=1 Tax=Terasakiella brassicae TaxID=1634917 RepID=UPI00166F2C36|nr:TolC family protein [Terasakiella brassicae]